MSSEYSESDNEGAPSDVLELEDVTTDNVLPATSKGRYEAVHQKFIDWRRENNIETSFSENVLMAYFTHIAKEFKPSSLWAIYSMLRRTIDVKDNVDITKYSKLKMFLKRQSDGYKTKKSKILTPADINKFIEEAPDYKYILMKTILIIGICGACRKQELRNMKMEDVDDSGKILHIKVPDMKTKKQRSFVVSGTCYKICKKYMALRLQVKDPSVHEFFLNYQRGKCTKQVVGHNKHGSVPKLVAEYLNLENPSAYTGHCFRRTSAAILVGAGGDLITLQRHGTAGSSMIQSRNEIAPVYYLEQFVEGSKNVTPKTYSKKENLDVPPTERPQLKRLNSEESCTSSLKDVPVKIKRITAPLEKVVSDARRGNEDSASTILLRIEAKLDKALLEIEDVKARLSSIEEKFDAEFGRQQVTQPDVYPIQSVKTFYELECDSFEKERKAQQKYLQNLRAKDMQSFVDVAFEKSIADDVIQNHFTLHGTDSKDKLEGTEFLNMIYCAAKRSKSFLGPSCLSELFPYVQETVSIIERLSNVPRRPEQTNDDSAVDPLQECNINISPHNEGNHCENEIENTGQSNYASDGFNGNEITFIKVEEESIVEETDEKPDLFVT